MNWTEFAIQAIACFIGTFGFALLMITRPKYLFFAALGGLITYVAWFFVDFYGYGDFVSNFAGASAGALYAEILARIFKTPTIEFSLSCVISLAPGSYLYYAMASFLNADYGAAFEHMVTALMIGLGIAVGMICVSVIPVILGKSRHRHKEIMEEIPNK